MPLTYDAWGNAQNSDLMPVWENAGYSDGRAPIGANGQIMTDSKGNRFQYSIGEYSGGADGWSGGGWKYLDDAALAAQQQQAAQGASTAYDFGKYGYTQDVTGLPTLAADTFAKGLNDPWLAKMYNTADKGSWYTGLGALTGDYQNLGALRLQGGNADPTAGGGLDYSDATYRDLASFMGIDPNASDYKEQVKAQAANYAMVKGMGGYNPGDERQVNQILYKRQANGEWAPVLNRAYHEREKGSWWSEGGKYIMVPLAVVGAGLAAGAMAGAGAGSGSAAGAGAATGGGITGTGGATGMAAYGAEGLGSYLGTAGTGSLGAGGFAGGSTLAGSLGAYGGAGLFGPGGITAAQAASLGIEPSMFEQAKKVYDTYNKGKKLFNFVKGLAGGQNGSGQGGRGMSGLNPSITNAAGWRSNYDAQTAALVNKMYSPVANEARMRGLAAGLRDELEE